MCEQGLKTRKNTAKWLLRHHPDQGGEPTGADVGFVASCMGRKSFCPGTVKPESAKKSQSQTQASNRPITRRHNPVTGEMSSVGRIFERVRVGHRDAAAPEAPLVAYKPSDRQLQCVRQVGNWSKIGPKHRFNKSRFSIAEVDKLIPIASPKMEALLQNIAALDANDMTTFGKHFKHFIFSDVKFLGYGAKIISAAMIARGFRPILKHEKSRIVVEVPKGGAGRNFAVLSSTALWDSPFKHSLKKDVLGVYNKRPDNVFGADCRFIILDSGFKEGIDLFDVKYVHLFEPLMTAADMTQALGRATRLCGQKGLEFIPNKGWPLHVFRYGLSIPQSLQPFYKAANLFEIALQLKGVDSRLGTITRAINDVSILSAVDQPLTEEIHKSGLLPRIVVKRSGATTAPSAELVSVKNTIDARSEATRANLISADKRLAYSQKLLLENAKTVAESLGNAEESVASDPCSPKVPDDCRQLSIVPFQPSRLSEATIVPTIVMENNELVIRQSSTASASAHTATKTKRRPTTWFELRRYVMEEFSEFKWPKQVIENKCVTPSAAAADKKTGGAKAAAGPKAKPAAEPEFKAPAKKAALPALALVNYTPTQAFIASYFTVESPIKGMLLWHSVGTGKTCTAIALASSQFERADYTIMWVTRHTLKADIWKNIFEQVCHASIADEVRRGLLKPEDAEKRQRKLYANWIPPVSYRQFSNIVQGKNPIYKMLQQRNGKADPLRKTLIIIDEAHKLYSSDFKGAEKPDVPAFMAALQNSYATSGADSARVLLMTATPYNESPMELMSLLNLCRPKKTWLPTELPAFIKKYMDTEGRFTQEGLLHYLDDIAGQISYLNREADPSQFAQPVFADVIVPMSTFNDVTEGDNDIILEMRQELAGLKDEKQTLINETIPYLEREVGRIGPAMDQHLAECERTFAGRKKEIKECQTRVTRRYKDGLKLEERNLRDARKRSEKIEGEYDKLSKKISRTTVKLRKTGKSALTQQAQLETRCKVGLLNP